MKLEIITAADIKARKIGTGATVYDMLDRKSRVVSKVSHAGGLFYMTDGTLEDGNNLVKYYKRVMK